MDFLLLWASSIIEASRYLALVAASLASMFWFIMYHHAGCSSNDYSAKERRGAFILKVVMILGSLYFLLTPDRFSFDQLGTPPEFTMEDMDSYICPNK